MFYKPTTTLIEPIDSSDDIVGLATYHSLPTEGILVIDRVDGSNHPTPSRQEYIRYKNRSAGWVIGVMRGIGGTLAQAHAAGAIVELVPTSSVWNTHNFERIATREPLLKRWFRYKR